MYVSTKNPEVHSFAKRCVAALELKAKGDAPGAQQTANALNRQLRSGEFWPEVIEAAAHCKAAGASPLGALFTSPGIDGIEIAPITRTPQPTIAATARASASPVLARPGASASTPAPTPRGSPMPSTTHRTLDTRDGTLAAATAAEKITQAASPYAPSREIVAEIEQATGFTPEQIARAEHRHSVNSANLTEESAYIAARAAGLSGLVRSNGKRIV